MSVKERLEYNWFWIGKPVARDICRSKLACSPVDDAPLSPFFLKVAKQMELSMESADSDLLKAKSFTT